ncbi:porin family protein [Mesorhizobium sp. PAMC28654]|uniref:outer membrane protein n=1 Tax=Mesorhizobium sp. PAMC28654 TaxID=2880934 RepID=UPI001D0B3F5F|nr:outer membrane protein [Mesorhizobium sp. PAMC28654]UDL87965.1 porin family protein [Mesorhizobium sp. PAMC28654]
MAAGLEMKKLLLSTVLVCVSGSSAFAADMVVAEAPTVYNWSGAYIGGVVGANFLRGNVTIPVYTPSDYDGDSTSASVGGQIGYQYQFENNFVLGAEARLVAVFNKKTVATTDTEDFRTGANWQGDIVAKAGYSMGNVLPYIKGGVAFLNLHDTGYEESNGPSALFNRTFTGWTVGAGVDYALNSKWIVGVDYAYAHFSSHDFSEDGPVGPTIVKPSTHTVSLTLNYRF